MAEAPGCKRQRRYNLAGRPGNPQEGREAKFRAATELRMPTPLELERCRFQGEHVVRITGRLVRPS